MNKEMPDLIKFAKGLISPEDLAVSGVLKPQKATRLIDLIVDNSAFLKKVSVERMRRLKKEIDVYDIANKVLVRVAEGSEPTDSQKTGISNIGKTLDALSVQLFADVKKSTILDNQDNPTFIRDLDNKFAKKFANELTLLGFTGIGTDGSDFDHLNEGWIHLAENSANTKKITWDNDSTDGSTDNYVTRLEKLLSVVDDDVLDSVTILMSPRDYEGYVKEISTDNKAINVLLNGDAKSFLGHPILPVRYFPSGKYMATPLENLVFGICGQIQRDRQYNARKRVVEYTFDIAVDYAIEVDKFCAICTPAV